MASKEALAYRYYINEKSQMVGVELIKDKKNPDGIFSMKSFKERFPGSMNVGRATRLPDKQVLVRIQPTGDILSEEATLDQINYVIEMWSDYAPLEKEEV